MQVARDEIEALFREEWGFVTAALIRTLGDFDLAEDAVQDSFTVALERWSEQVPPNPRAWILTTARNKAIDRLRRDRVLVSKVELLNRALGEVEDPTEEAETSTIPDERLRLIFTCCHPALAMEARVALTLRALGRLTTPEIADAFLVPESTMSQRLVRAKRKIREAGIPYRVPPPDSLNERMRGVLGVVYLIFNEGYAASSGPALIRSELCQEAIRLGRVLATLSPGESEVLSLLALMLLQNSRSEARSSASGDLILLEDQDRSLWDWDAIQEGTNLLKRARRLGRRGPYLVQAGIAAEHAKATAWEVTDWRRIVILYDELLSFAWSPIVALNRAVAVSFGDSFEKGLELVEGLSKELDGFHLYHATRADLMRRLGRIAEARAAYERALELTKNDAERVFLNQQSERLPM